MGTTELTRGEREGIRSLQRSFALAEGAGVEWCLGSCYVASASGMLSLRDYQAAAGYIEAGLRYCGDRGFELFRLYLLAFRSRVELDEGQWNSAISTAAAVMRVPRASTTPRIIALAVSALAHARRGDSGYAPLLDEAWTLAAPTGELMRMGPVAAARAEAAWIEGRSSDIRELTQSSFELAVQRQAHTWTAEFASWRRRAGIVDQTGNELPERYRAQLSGDSNRAAHLWAELGCPYESALALADSDDEETLRRAFDELQRLGAKPAVAIVGRRLRERGARGVPRGPRPTTLENPARLTRRELEVLGHLTEGRRNAEIARRLFLSEKTVDHHVSAILRKLRVHTRHEASIEAARLGLSG